MTQSDREFLGGAVATTLTGGTLTDVATSIPIAASTNWPTGTGAKTFVIIINRGQDDEEKVLINSRSGLTLTVASSGRGYDGTSAQEHAVTATVEHCVDASWLQEINEHYNDTALDHHTQYLNTARHDVTARHTFGAALGTPAAAADITTSASAGAAAGPARADHAHKIGAGAINSAGMFAAGVVDAAAIATDAVDSAEIKAGAVGAAELASDAVTTVKILDLNVTSAKLAAASVTAGKIGAGGISAASQFAAGVVDTAAILDGTILLADLATALQNWLCPSGMVAWTAAAAAPNSEWLYCDGASYLRATYAALFAAIGTTYGSADGTHFNVPDIKGRTIAGKESASTRLTSATAGIDGATLGAAGGDQRLHAHTHINTLNNPTHSHQVGVMNPGSVLAAGGDWQVDVGNSGSTAPGLTLTNVAAGTGASQNVQPTIVLYPIIKI